MQLKNDYVDTTKKLRTNMTPRKIDTNAVNNKCLCPVAVVK